MTTEYEYTMHRNGVVTQAEVGPPRAFFIMNRYDWCKERQCYTDNLTIASTFMWGRRFCEYTLYVNDRIYDWGDSAELSDIEDHLLYCRDMDDTLYPADEFPREHWWV